MDLGAHLHHTANQCEIGGLIFVGVRKRGDDYRALCNYCSKFSSICSIHQVGKHMRCTFTLFQWQKIKARDQACSKVRLRSSRSCNKGSSAFIRITLSVT